VTYFDVVIMGAGIAGASLAAELVPHRSVLLLEAEVQPGYHTTGRSNAFWHATYGGPLIEPLTSASLDWLRTPPQAFAESGFLSLRGAITLARDEDRDALEVFAAGFAASDVALERWDRRTLERHVPVCGVRGRRQFMRKAATISMWLLITAPACGRCGAVAEF
jgi:D-arginine dehydrogenase